MTSAQCSVSIEKEDFEVNIVPNNDKDIVPQLEKTNHTAQYNQFFHQIIQKNVKLKIDSCLSALVKNGIIYDPQTFYEFQFEISKQVTVNLQIVKAEIKWGYFIMNINILNNLSESYFHYCESREGSFGKIFFLQHPTESFAIKCIALDWKLNKSENIKRNALKEFFISKISSALGCGSKMNNFIGFDLVFSNSCIEFSMEKCYPLRSQSTLILEQMKMNLYILHYFRIIHFDIKLENIMFSRLQEKYVFIDFGLSDMLKQQMGWKYLHNFKGTPNFCSPQMSLAFGSEFKCYIDPYYNDIYCLRGSFSQIKDHSDLNNIDYQYISEFYGIDLIQTFQNRQNIQNVDTDLEYRARINQLFSFIAVLKFKYSLFIQRQFPNQQIKYLTGLNIVYIYREVIKFINEAFHLKILRKYYREIIPSLTKQSIQFQWLKQKIKPTFLNRDLKIALSFETKQKIIRYFEGIDMNKKIQKLVMFNFPDKHTILSKIFDINSHLDIQISFVLFMQYISFTNNTCNVKNQERISLIRRFNSYNFKTQVFNNNVLDLNTQDCNVFPFQELLNAFGIILSWYSSNQFDLQQQGEQVSQRIGVIFDIIEHMFVLRLIPTQQLLLRLNTIYEYAFFTSEHKIEFILKIKHFSEWIIFLPQQKIIINHEEVQEFWRRKFDQFQIDSIQPALNTIYNMIKQSRLLSLQEIKRLFSNQYYDKIPQSLKFQLGFEYYKQGLYMTDYGQSSDLFEELFSILPVQLKSKSFYFYNYVFLTFINAEGDNLDILREIHQIFEKNLNSSILASQLVTYKIIKILQAGHEERTRLLLPITQILNQNNLYYFDQLIIHLLKYYKNDKQWAPVQQTLKNFFKKVSFKNILAAIPAVCFKKILMYDYFIFKYQCSKMDASLFQSYAQEMEQFSIYKETQTCNICKYVFLCTYFQLTVNNNIRLNHSWLTEIVKQFTNLQEYFTLHKDIFIDKYFVYIRYNNYFEMISAYIKQNIFSDQVSSIAKDLYYIIKQNGDVFIYLEFLQKSPNLVYITILTLHQNVLQSSKAIENCFRSLAFEELIGFIKSLLNINVVGQTGSYLNYLTLVFEKYIAYSLRNDRLILKAVLEQIDKQQKDRTIYSNIFYFAYILRADQKERQKYLIKMYSWWDYLSKKMLLFYQFNLYCLFIYRFPQYLSKNKLTFQGVEENKPLASNNRKRFYQQKKILKIFTKMQKITTRYKYKIQKRYGLIIMKLFQKCSKYGGPYYANQHRLILALIPGRKIKS